MSTFSGLNTAYTGLVAARQGLNVVGQNIANANTEGYTRQRVSTSSIGALERTGLLTGGVQIGQGVSVDAIARLGDMHLDTRVRFSAGVAGYSAARANAMSDLEASLREPGKNGISAQLQDFWASWQDLSNRPNDPAAGGVVLEEANILANMIRRGYQEVREQFSRVRSNVDTMAAEVNGTASQVASLNEKIRFAVANGGSANELMDHRNLLTERLAALTGATVRQGSDGQVDVLIGGNALVTGSSAHRVRIDGDTDISGIDGVKMMWETRDAPMVLDGGEIAGALSMLGAGPGVGPLRQAADSYNGFARGLAEAVNGVHAAGFTRTGAGAGDFFEYDSANAAQSLNVLVASSDKLATAGAAGSPLDGSHADKISQLAHDPDVSPDRHWEQIVTKIGVQAKTELQQANLADIASQSAKSLQISNASVDLDEENVNLLSYQHAYQGAARVMTAIDEMLDTLINRTGLVGR
ncbi:flagellar hook-associated protein FlgK [Arthrobacter sulfonylureivorans]|uniref:Flagellar hook-associated protein 1 n=1 Tax=Arthrobacter sulfonylureivorans TaxID=2486855 RepID=A0ABY3WBF8_9MICC|nr:flagellar hook-associated protein FlgK [Arthrobacter sulfonylureivorans]UNK46792.1 flagellar hook-associated protein FlgK [Arthrobacter sulfonylureivorans]